MVWEVWEGLGRSGELLKLVWQRNPTEREAVPYPKAPLLPGHDAIAYAPQCDLLPTKSTFANCFSCLCRVQAGMLLNHLCLTYQGISSL